MWILECEGPALQGKRIWLRPGKTYLFGRTKTDAGFFQIDHKSVSRKHLVLKVSEVKAGDGSKLFSHSQISVKDEQTKFGTDVNGIKLKGEEITLEGNRHTLSLGNSNMPFHITWQPVVLTFVFPSKETKGGRDPLVAVRSRLEEFDIKFNLVYLNEQTTHVVTMKRNTAKGLQALISGKYVVQNSFVDALVYATTPDNLDEPETLSPLEVDFDGNWPSELEHIPPPGKEPGKARPNETFAPDTARKDVFEGYTFILCDRSQFDNLQGPITNGGGKALKFDFKPGQTKAIEIVRFAKQCNGEEGVGEFSDHCDGRGAVLVSFPLEKGYEQWTEDLQFTVAQMLDHRLVAQNEFLDAILMNDASPLRRRLPREEGHEEAGSPSVIPTSQPEPASGPQNGSTHHDIPALTTTIHEDPPTSPEENSVPQPESIAEPIKAQKRVVSYFTGFDEDFEPPPAAQRRKLNGSTQTKASQFQAPQDADEEELIEEQVAQSKQEPVTTRTPRKRRLSPALEEDAEDQLQDRLLPAAAAMKKRRLETEGRASRRETPALNAENSVEARLAAKKKATKPINIKKGIRETREAAEEKRRKVEEGEGDENGLDGLNVNDLRNLAIVEDMDIKPRKSVLRGADSPASQSDRWDERWNGRKNFKKFRRKGDANALPPRRGLTIMVALEEVKKKDYGIGEGYWEEAGSSRKEKDKGSRRSNRDSGTLRSQQTQSTPHTGNNSAEIEVPAELMTNREEHTVVKVDAPRRTRRQDGTASQQVESSGKGVAGRKTALNGKRKVFEEKDDDDSDSEEGLRFKFKRKKR
ncbi:hypothetical protein MMC25_007249 [Agyrium rufum]|nr:hypothetical protein [Agyrium rufum]